MALKILKCKKTGVIARHHCPAAISSDDQRNQLVRLLLPNQVASAVATHVTRISQVTHPACIHRGEGS